MIGNTKAILAVLALVAAVGLLGYFLSSWQWRREGLETPRIRVKVEVIKPGKKRPVKTYKKTITVRDDATALRYLVEGQLGNIHAQPALLARMVAGYKWFRHVRGEPYIASNAVLRAASWQLHNKYTSPLWTATYKLLD